MTLIRITTIEGTRHGSSDDPPDVRTRLLSKRSALRTRLDRRARGGKAIRP